MKSPIGPRCRIALVFTVGSTLLTTVASATQTPVPLRSALIKESGLIKIVAKPDRPLVLPGLSPGVTPNENMIRIANNGGELVDPLTAGTWQTLGNAPASIKGYRYLNPLAPIGGDCRVILIKKTMVKAICRGMGSIPTPLAEGANGDIDIQLSFNDDSSVYCARATAPHHREKEGKLIRARNQSAPDSCPCVEGTDSDGDRLDDCHETNTGAFVSATNTGTNPNERDTDGDFLEDGDEVLGTIAGLDLPALGTDPLKKNILIEYDWFEDSISCGFHSHQPRFAQIERVRAAFADAPVANPDGTTGITMIQDYGQGPPFSGGNLIADSDGVLSSGVNGTEFKNHKLANFDATRDGYFHYTILPHRYNTSSGSSGQAELPGDDMIVSLQCSYASTNSVANTIAHELGHNLDLRHGGYHNCNYKPNYNSVMNYKYQFPGVDNDCTPPGNGILDYSNGDRIDLDETNLLETHGTCGAPQSVDWNSDGIIDKTPISHDINSGDTSQNTRCGGTLTILEDYDDWANIEFDGLTSADGAHRRPVEVIDCDNPLAPRF